MHNFALAAFCVLYAGWMAGWLDDDVLLRAEVCLLAMNKITRFFDNGWGGGGWIGREHTHIQSTP